MADKLMRTFVVMSFFLVLALFSGCGANGTTVTNADNGNQVKLRTGETLTLSLESNPSTGYSWQVLEHNEAILTQEGSPEFTQTSGAEGLVGASGMETFHFKAVHAGKTTLDLGYMRPWESVSPAETFTVEVAVQ